LSKYRTNVSIAGSWSWFPRAPLLIQLQDFCLGSWASGVVGLWGIYLHNLARGVLEASAIPCSSVSVADITDDVTINFGSDNKKPKNLWKVHFVSKLKNAAFFNNYDLLVTCREDGFFTFWGIKFEFLPRMTKSNSFSVLVI
jgi:hypothetical protein